MTGLQPLILQLQAIARGVAKSSGSIIYMLMQPAKPPISNSLACPAQCQQQGVAANLVDIGVHCHQQQQAAAK
jgi:hypothetical protein